MPEGPIDELLPSIDASGEFRERARAELSAMWRDRDALRAEPSGRAGGGERRGWIVLGAAAAIVVVALAGLALVRDGGDGPGSVSAPPTVGVGTSAATMPTTPSSTSPNTSPITSPITAEESTTAPTASVVSTTSGTTLPPSEPGEPISVSFAEPPQVIEPVRVAQLDAGSGGAALIALGDGFAVAGVPGFGTPDGRHRLLVVDLSSGSIEELGVDPVPTGLVAGPGPVVYGELIDERGATVVAIALSGERAGETVWSGPSAGHALEPFDNIFAQGPDGIVDRWNDDALVTPYLDERGAPISVDGRWPVVPLIDVEDGAVVRSSTGGAWALAIERDPAAPASMHNTVAAGPAGSVVVSTWIGPRTGGGPDHGTPSVPVVAVLRPDGSGSWYRLPEGWTVVDSNRWGTLVARFTDASVELGLIDPLIVSDVGWREIAVVDAALDDTIPRFATDAEQLDVLASELGLDALPTIDLTSQFVAAFTAQPRTCTTDFALSFDGSTWQPSYASAGQSCPARTVHRTYVVALDRLAVHWPIRLMSANDVQAEIDVRTGSVVENGIEIVGPPAVECSAGGGHVLVVTIDSLVAGPAALTIEDEGAPVGGSRITLDGRRRAVRIPVRDEWLDMESLRVSVDGTDELGGFALATIGDLGAPLRELLPANC